MLPKLHVSLAAMVAGTRTGDIADCLERQQAAHAGFPLVSAKDTDHENQAADAAIELLIGDHPCESLELSPYWLDELATKGPLAVDVVLARWQAAVTRLDEARVELHDRRDAWHRSVLARASAAGRGNEERKVSDTCVDEPTDALLLADEPSLQLDPNLLLEVATQWWLLSQVIFDWVRPQWAAHTTPEAFRTRYAQQMRRYAQAHRGQQLVCLTHGGMGPSLPLRPRTDYHDCLLCLRDEVPTRDAMLEKQQAETRAIEADFEAQMQALRMA